MHAFILFFPPYVLVMCIRKFTFSYTGTTGWLQLSSFFSSCYTYAGSFRVIIVVYLATLILCIRKFTFLYTGTTGWLQLSSFFSSCYTYAGSFRVIIVVIWQHLYCVHILYFAVVIMLFQV